MSDFDLLRDRVHDNAEGDVTFGRDEVAELLAAYDRLHSWDGLIALLNEHWPDDIFVTAPDPEDYHEPLYWMRRDAAGVSAPVRANPGVIIIGLIRWVDRLTREAANASRNHIAEVQAMEREYRAEQQGRDVEAEQ